MMVSSLQHCMRNQGSHNLGWQKQRPGWHQSLGVDASSQCSVTKIELFTWLWCRVPGGYLPIPFFFRLLSFWENFCNLKKERQALDKVVKMLLLGPNPVLD